MKPTAVVILLLLGGMYSASAMPSAACLVASQTENVIRCLSLNENFQETLASGDLCEQARVVYTCYNRTCCEENRAYDIERDPSIAACNIDCLRTTPPPSTSSTSAAWTTPPPEPVPSEAPYITTMAPFSTPSPDPPPDILPSRPGWPFGNISMPSIAIAPDALSTITLLESMTTHGHALVILAIVPMSIATVWALWHSFTNSLMRHSIGPRPRSAPWRIGARVAERIV